MLKNILRQRVWVHESAAIAGFERAVVPPVVRITRKRKILNNNKLCGRPPQYAQPLLVDL